MRSIDERRRQLHCHPQYGPRPRPPSSPPTAYSPGQEGPLRIRSGSGLGDALYLQSIARYFVLEGYKVEVFSKWPDVFTPLRPNVTVSAFMRGPRIIPAHYSLRRRIQGTNQWQDCCIAAGITEPAEMALDWVVQDEALVEPLRRVPYLAVQLPRTPMDRIDNVGRDLLPDCCVIQQVIDLVHSLNPGLKIVQLGSGRPLYQFTGLDLDLANKTTVTDLLDVAACVRGFIGYVSFLVPLAESLRKPTLLVWSRKGLKGDAFSRTVTPQKIITASAATSYVIDDCSGYELRSAVLRFLEQVSTPPLV